MRPKTGTPAEWLQPDSHFCLHSRLLVFSTSSVRGPLEGCGTEVLQGCRKLTWMRSDSPERMQKGGFIWFWSFLTLYFFPWNFTDFCFPELLLQLQNVDSFLIRRCLISNIFTVKTRKWTNIFRLLSKRPSHTSSSSRQSVGVDVFLFPLLLNVSRFLSPAAQYQIVQNIWTKRVRCRILNWAGTYWCAAFWNYWYLILTDGSL